MTAAIGLLTAVDLLLLVGVALSVRRVIRSHSFPSMRVVWPPIVVLLLGFIFAITGSQFVWTALFSIALACMVFFSRSLDVWLTNKARVYSARKMSERPDLKERMEKNVILRTANRFNRWQRKG